VLTVTLAICAVLTARLNAADIEYANSGESDQGETAGSGGALLTSTLKSHNDSVPSRGLEVDRERDGIFGGLGVHPQTEMNDRRSMHRAVDYLLFSCRPRDAKMSRSTFMKKIMTYFLPFGGAPKTVGHGDVGKD